ncbi:hypothetical protein NQ314_007367 [Rhamnusium bicolor]|uniref:Uncharacterized protein n=1 Tax=Rhamnusium bicolor TaxID=1586634 RepID=A0AAV8YNQ9_9CUCU|nr:hypothetical protein NQ314_007367 [Rhamnusium bicolor]
MTVISKELFYERIDSSTKCSTLHYWEENCLRSMISPIWIGNVVKGSAKFFLPIYLLKLKIFGRLHYYNLLFFPGMISGLSLLVETEENQIMDTLIYFNTFIEAILTNLHYYNIFKFTKTRETLLFMAVSATLMHTLETRTKKLDYLYFLGSTLVLIYFNVFINGIIADIDSHVKCSETIENSHSVLHPAKKKFDRNGDSKENRCNHLNNCYNFISKGFLKYFTLGYAVNIIRKLLPKALTCYFVKTGILGKAHHGLIAGFFSGLAYAISPNMQVLVVGITTLLQVLINDSFLHSC